MRKHKLFIATLGVLLLALLMQTKVAAQNSEDDFTMPYPEYWLYPYGTNADGSVNYCHPDAWSPNSNCANDVNSVPDNGPLYSPVSGSVVDVGNITDGKHDGFGNSYAVIKNTCRTVYMLHGSFNIVAGQRLTLGQHIGHEASVGNSTGPHTHLTVYDQCLGTWVNPSKIVTVLLSGGRVASMEEIPLDHRDFSPDPQPGQFGGDLQMPSIIATARAAELLPNPTATPTPTLSPTAIAPQQTTQAAVEVETSLERLFSRDNLLLLIAALLLIVVFLISGDQRS